jgi:hypothetical protein
MPDDFYLILGLVALIVTSFMTLIYILFSDRGLGRGASSATSQSDLTNMMILFQTMRDILTQQKDLAREFNISIDNKVNEVRRLIQSTGDVRKELDRTRHELAALGTRTRKDIQALERRLQGVDLPAVPEADAVDDDAVVPMEDDVIEELQPLEEIAPPLEIIPEPESKEDLNVFDRWRLTGAAEEAEPDGIEIEDDYEYENGTNGHDEPLSEDEVAETRAAYRDLLNLQPTGSRMRGPSSSELLENGREANGGQYLTPIQKRVYEYSDAGMRVPEIARELGVGKGEVRLILSLRHDRGQ